MGTIKIPNSVLYIGSGAFQNCTSLATIDFPENIETVGSYAFDGTTWLNNLPEGLTYIGKIAFKYKEKGYGNVEVIIKEGTLKIAPNAFLDCSNVVAASLPNSLAYIGEGAFSGASKLTSINIPLDIDTIYERTFKDCISLSSIELPEGLKAVRYEAFHGCISLKSITFPCSVTGIGDASFSGCKNLTTVKLPDGLESIGYAFEGCSSLESIVIPNSVKTIRQWAFQGCKGLKTAIIGDGVQNIGAEAFSNCGLEELKVLSIIPPIAYPNTFSNYSIPLYVHDTSLDTYKTTEPWKNFKSIVAIDDSSNIHGITLGNDTDVLKYDLNGRKLKETVKGINIFGGKKVVVNE